MEQLAWLWKKRWEIAWVGGNKGMIADRLYMYSTCVRVGGGGGGGGGVVTGSCFSGLQCLLLNL